MNDERPKTVPRIRIISIPPGEAPLWAREKWVGLTLPVTSSSRGPGPFTTTTFDFVTGPAPATLAQFEAGIRGKPKFMSGFHVKTQTALEILETDSPEAAEWWRDQIAHTTTPTNFLLFDKDCCAIVV